MNAIKQKICLITLLVIAMMTMPCGTALVAQGSTFPENMVGIPDVSYAK